MKNVKFKKKKKTIKPNLVQVITSKQKVGKLDIKSQG